MAKLDTRTIQGSSGNAKPGFLGFIEDIAGTMLDAHDNYHISVSHGDFQRTISIPTGVEIDGVIKQIGSTDFDITREESAALFNNGVKAAKSFLSAWDFSEWKKKYRENKGIQPQTEK